MLNFDSKCESIHVWNFRGCESVIGENSGYENNVQTNTSEILYDFIGGFENTIKFPFHME
jgi:hypothetical protein